MNVSEFMKMKNLTLNKVNKKVATFSLLCFFVVNLSFAQSSIEDIDVRTGENGSVVVDFSFSGEVPQPETFSTQLPPRLAMDFSNTVNASSQRNIPVGYGSTKGIRLVSSNDKTRVVVDLMNPVEHEITYSGNVLSLSLQGSNRQARSSTSEANSVNMVDFRRGMDGQGIIQIGLTNSDAIINYSESMGKVTVEIDNSQLDAAMDKKLDVIDFATPVTYVDARQSGNDVKIEIDVNGPYEKVVYQTGNEYTIEIEEQV